MRGSSIGSRDTSVVGTSRNSSESGDRSSCCVRAKCAGAHSCSSNSNSGVHRGSASAGFTVAATAVSTKCNKAALSRLVVWLWTYWLRRLLSSRGTLPEQAQSHASCVTSTSNVVRLSPCVRRPRVCFWCLYCNIAFYGLVVILGSELRSGVLSALMCVSRCPLVLSMNS